MTLHAPRLPVSLDPLIAEAKLRARQRRFFVVLFLAAGLSAGLALALRSSPSGPGSGGPPDATAGAVARISSKGIGGVRIGASKRHTVAMLSRVLGPPSRRFVSDGCGSTAVTEVAWSHFYAEFRNDSFSGYRYLSGTWLRRGVFPGHNLSTVQPHLATVAGITIGDPLRQLRRADGPLAWVGTARWQDTAGLVFYDNAARFPDPASSRVIEIKYGTCGDF